MDANKMKKAVACIPPQDNLQIRQVLLALIDEIAAQEKRIEELEFSAPMPRMG